MPERCDVCGQRQHTAWCDQVAASLQKEQEPTKRQYVRRADNPQIAITNGRKFGPPAWMIKKIRAQAEREKIAIQYRDEYLAGRTLEEVAHLHGKTRERIRQVIEEFYPALLATTYKKRRTDGREATRAKRMAARPAEQTKECVVCFREFTTRNRNIQTCSDNRCVIILRNARWIVVPSAHERQRWAVCTWNTQNPDKARAPLVASSQKALDYHARYGFMPPPNRAYNCHGKHALMLLEIGGPELVAKHMVIRDAHYAGRPRLHDDLTPSQEEDKLSV